MAELKKSMGWCDDVQNKNKYNKLINRYNKLTQERSKVLINNNNDESWLNQLEKSISLDALKIYSLRENQLNVLINILNIYLKNTVFLLFYRKLLYLINQ